jgi:DegV family protein with EDD domain
MRKLKIVADSSANLLTLDQVAFASAPLKIITSQREFVDDQQLDVQEMVSWFDTYNGKSKTSCPNSSDWLEAFGDADEVFCVTITSGLSGSYNAANVAKQIYESDNPGKQVYVIDSLSAGPELALIVEELCAYVEQGMDFQQMCDAIQGYTQKTGLLFMLGSLKNFAANGRVSPAVAKITGLLGIRIVGRASDEGTLEPMDKCRGEAKSLDAIVTHLKEYGLSKGKVRIAHCCNETAAQALQERLAQQLPQVQVAIQSCRGLCSYYAEKGGLLVGFEKF